MKHFLITIGILVLSLTAQAQELRIVKDNINCSYGLKDDEGKWVVDPIYTLIQTYNSGYFLVKDALGDGLLSPNGKWILPCEYDRIDVKLTNWVLMYDYNMNQKTVKAKKSFFMIGVKGDRQYLLNSQGNTIMEMAVGASCERDDGKHFIIHQTSPLRASYIDTLGKALIDELPGSILPFRNKSFSLRSDAQHDYGRTAVGNVQLIDRNGKVLNDQTFDVAIITTRNRICFENDSKYGVMKVNGEMIIPPNYEREVPLANPESNKDGWVIVDSLGKKGLMASNGKIIHEPKYDKMHSMIGVLRKPNGWKVEWNGKFGVMDIDGRWLIPAKYDKVIPFNYLVNGQREFRTSYIVTAGSKWGYVLPEVSKEPAKFYEEIEGIASYNYSYQQSIGKALVVKSNGKYGLMNLDGTIHTSCIYDNHMRRGRVYDTEFFYKDRKLKEFVFNSGLVQEKVWTKFLKVEDEIIFTDGRAYISAQISRTDGQIVHIEMENDFREYGNLFVLNMDSRGCFNIYNKTTSKKVKLKNVTDISWSSNDRFVIRTKSNNSGVIDQNGKVLIDTLYNTIQMTNDENRIWGSRMYSNSVYKWALMDSNGVRVTNTLFDQSFEVGRGDQLVRKGRRTGLLDTEKFTWKIKPVYPCLYRMVDQYYLAINLKGKKGLMRSNGTVFIQPVYDTIVLLAANCSPSSTVRKDQEPEFRWLVRQGKSEAIIDQDGKKISNSSQVQSFKESLFFEDTTLLKQNNQIRNFPVLDYSPSLDFHRGFTAEEMRTKRRALWKDDQLKRAVFNKVNEYWSSAKVNCNSPYGVYLWAIESGTDSEERIQKMCNCATSRNASYGGYLISYKLRSIGARFATVSQSFQNSAVYGWDHLRSQAPPPNPGDEYMNIVVENGKSRFIELSDIFPNDSTLMEEFVVSLQKRDDLKLECSSLENMLEMVGGKFKLTQHGVRLYLNQYNGNYSGVGSMVELLIPLENLSQHDESKWIVPILSEE